MDNIPYSFTPLAEHEIKGKNDVKKALDLLKECDLLRIEDLLPFFSDFQKIDDFKEAICDALKVRAIDPMTPLSIQLNPNLPISRNTTKKSKTNSVIWTSLPKQLNVFVPSFKHFVIVPLQLVPKNHVRYARSICC